MVADDDGGETLSIIKKMRNEVFEISQNWHEDKGYKAKKFIIKILDSKNGHL